MRLSARCRRTCSSAKTGVRELRLKIPTQASARSASYSVPSGRSSMMRRRSRTSSRPPRTRRARRTRRPLMRAARKARLQAVAKKTTTTTSSTRNGRSPTRSGSLKESSWRSLCIVSLHRIVTRLPDPTRIVTLSYHSRSPCCRVDPYRVHTKTFYSSYYT